VNEPNPRFLICGSGRSGTSAVAQLLHHAGVSVGNDLVEADEHNAEGYFEERQVILINQAILHAAGVGPPLSTATRQQVLDAAQEYVPYMLDQVGFATPAWKDPRFCWTLEPWLSVLEGRPRIIICLRSPAEVAASTMRYFGQVGGEARNAVYHVWRVQYERLLDVIEAYALNAMTVAYDELHANAEAVVSRLASFVGLPLDASSIRADLRHHAVQVPPELRALYDRVQAVGLRP
jgi:hypothetical protein